MSKRWSEQQIFLLNSTTAFACAEMVTTMLHEFGHAFMARAAGATAHVFPFRESNSSVDPHAQLLIDIAGPATSLALGIVLVFIHARGRERYSYGRLLLFWSAWAALMEFVNYMIITPWVAGGDSGHIATLLHAPPYARYATAALGVGITIALAPRAAASMLSVAPESFVVSTSADRRRYFARGFYLPVIFGTALLAAIFFGGNANGVAFGLFGVIGTLGIVGSAIAFGSAVPARSARLGASAVTFSPFGLALYLLLLALFIGTSSRGIAVPW